MNLKKKIIAVWAAALLAGGIAGGTAGPALAGTSYSTWLNFGGSSYSGRSYLNNTTKVAGAETKTATGWTASSGWLGVQGRLYNDATGALCRTGGWQYNSPPATSILGGLTSGYCGSTAYYGFSVSRGWDSFSSTYFTCYDNRTPSLNF